MSVLKRDGRNVEFDETKPRKAILQAFKAVDGEVMPEAEEIADRLVQQIANKVQDEQNIEAERIQDLIETGLMASRRKDVAKAFILYRDKRTKVREKNSELMKTVHEKLSASNVQNQNANMDEHSFGGRMGESNSAVMKQIALDELVSETTKNNHLNNEVYIHDLDSYAAGMHNCLSCPVDQLLENGFNTRQTDIRPANSVNTAMQLIAVIFQLQSLQQFGGVSATHIDWTMVPYVRKSFYKHYKEVCETLNMLPLVRINAPKLEDVTKVSIEDKCYRKGALGKIAAKCALRLTIKETEQATEGMFHNLNTLQSRSGNQLPFSSINYGTCTLKEGRIVTKAILEASIRGVGKLHRTSIFPCQIFQCMRGVNRKPGDPNYDLYRLALKSTAKRLYPNYANCDWSAQRAWVKADRDLKRKALALLSRKDYDALVEAGYKNPDELAKMNMYIEDNVVIVDDKQTPTEIFSTMGCRTANGGDINFTIDDVLNLIKSFIKTGKLPIGELYSSAQKDGRGNICPATIILPTIAMEAKEANPDDVVETFMKMLDQKISECAQSLIDRYNWIISQKPEAAKFMYENSTMAGEKYILNLSKEEAFTELYSRIKDKILMETKQDELPEQDNQELINYVRSRIEKDTYWHSSESQK